MDEDAGVLRSADSLHRAADELRQLARSDSASPSTEDWETTNLHQIATVLVRHATQRQETRGSHWREDFPERDEGRWRVRLLTRVEPGGALTTREEPVTGDAQ
jgi:L-aspartate oxidase